MAKTAEAVSSFLSELGKKLRPLGDADLAEMLHLKEAEVSFSFIIFTNMYDYSTLVFKICLFQITLTLSFPSSSFFWLSIAVQRIRAWFWWKDQLLGHAILHDHGRGKELRCEPKQVKGILPSSCSYQGYVNRFSAIQFYQHVLGVHLNACKPQGPFVQGADNAIQWILCYPVDKSLIL